MAHCVRDGVSYKRHNWDKDLVCKGCKLDAKTGKKAGEHEELVHGVEGLDTLPVGEPQATGF